jgi:hypothetical protein
MAEPAPQIGPKPAAGFPVDFRILLPLLSRVSILKSRGSRQCLTLVWFREVRVDAPIIHSSRACTVRHRFLR